MKFKAFVTVIVFLSVLIKPILLYAQWQQIYQVPSLVSGNNAFGCILYKNNTIYICVGSNLYISKDTTKTWVIKPIPGTSSITGVMDLDFINDSVGVFCCFGNVFLTSDQGNIWRKLNVAGYQTVNFVGSANKIMVDAHFSTDGGNSWIQTIPPEIVLCARFNFVNGLTYAQGSNTGNMYVSRDSGLNWSKTPGNYDGDSWSFSVDSCKNNSTIYIANEDCATPKNGLGEVFVSTNDGNSWTSHFAKPICHISGSIATGRRGVFCPTVNDAIYRSIDQGKTWIPIGGPSSPVDTRMIAAINDNIIVAGDAQGGIWITYNSGGVPLPKPISTPFIQSPHFKAGTSCSVYHDSLLLIPRSECIFHKTVITEFSKQGVDSSLFDISLPKTPYVTIDDSVLTIPVVFSANGHFGIVSGSLHIHGYYITSEDSTVFDTTIVFTIPITAEPPKLLSNFYSCTYPILSTCSPPVDTTVILINHGCDTLLITQGPGSLAPEFTLLPPFTLPIKLAPGDSTKIVFRFFPSSTGTFFTRPRFTAEQQGLKQDIDLYLEGSGKLEGGVFSYFPKKFDFKSLSICNHDSASGFVTNIGCDSLGLDAAQIFGDKDFKLSANSSQLTVRPKDTVNYKVYLNPVQKGLRQGKIVFTSHVNGNTKQDSVAFTATVTDGTRFLASPISALNFGTTTMCEEKDSVVHLTNTGCDTLKVFGITGLGSGFGSNAKFPIIIPPNTDTTIDIFTVLDTTGGKLISTATLGFISDADTILPPVKIDLKHSYIASARHDAALYLDNSAKLGENQSIVTYDIKESKSFTGSGIKNVNFDLSYNTDLLEFEPSKSSANISSPNGKNFTLTGSPEIKADGNSILATIGFRVYLTKDSITNITLTSRIDTFNALCIFSTLSVGGSATFDYQFLCGERSIQHFLNGRNILAITAIRPNPTNAELDVDIHSNEKQEQQLEIFDELGVKVYARKQMLSSGKNSIHLDTKSLSSGVYLLKIGEASQSFVKVK